MYWNTMVLALAVGVSGTSRDEAGACITPPTHWSDYYGALAFVETPFEDMTGIRRLTRAEARAQNHYRFDYDRGGRLIRLTFALDDTPRDPNHTANYLYESTTVEICHGEGWEHRRFLDRAGNPMLVRGNIAEERYTLDSLGYRTGLTFHDPDGRAVQSGSGAARFVWRMQKDGTVIEERFDSTGALAPLRSGLPFYRTRLRFGPNGWLALFENVDSAGGLVRNALGAAQDKLEYRKNGDMIAWNVYDEQERRVEGNGPMVARGIREMDGRGYEAGLYFQDRYGRAMANAYGFDRTETTFDRFGNIVERTNYDANGRAVDNPRTGYAGYRYQWDRSGRRELAMEFFDAGGRVVAHQERGYARMEQRYDRRGNRTEIRYLDPRGRLIARTDIGVARIVMEYDSRDRLRRRRYLDAAGAPVALRGASEEAFAYRPDGYLDRVVRNSFVAGGAAHQARRPGPDRVPLDTALAAELGAMLLDAAELPGFGVAALQEGRVVYARGFGYRDLARRLPVDSGTAFRAASVSKVVAATAALALYQRGVLDLDRPVGRLLPGYPDSADGITARRLAAHLAGLPHYESGATTDGRHYPTAREALGIFRGARPVGAPGERYHYSTHGFTLLSAMMEAAADKPILEILTDEVLTPLGMGRTGGEQRSSLPPYLTVLYQRGQGGLVPITRPTDYSYSWAGAGLLSTPSDLVRMTTAYFDGRLHDSTVRLALTPQRTADGTDIGVGFAWRVGTDWRGRRIAHHAGVTPGTRSVVLMYPDRQTSVALMTNRNWTSSIESTAMVLLEALTASERHVTHGPVSTAWTGSFAGDSVAGHLHLVDGAGTVTVPPVLRALFARDGTAPDVLQLRAIRNDLYALVTPWGLYPVVAERSAGRFRLRTNLGAREWIITT